MTLLSPLCGRGWLVTFQALAHMRKPVLGLEALDGGWQAPGPPTSVPLFGKKSMSNRNQQPATVWFEKDRTGRRERRAREWTRSRKEARCCRAGPLRSPLAH
ncbi:hypothetical protein HDK64DRAFT_269927 [Phyllosticta capitalensis]